MTLKIAALILALGASGATMLALRQQRLDAARELAEARLRAHELNEQLARVRARIAELAHPERIEHLAERLGPMRPIVRPERPEPTPRAAEGPIDLAGVPAT